MDVVLIIYTGINANEAKITRILVDFQTWLVGYSIDTKDIQLHSHGNSTD